MLHCAFHVLHKFPWNTWSSFSTLHALELYTNIPHRQNMWTDVVKSLWATCTRVVHWHSTQTKEFLWATIWNLKNSKPNVALCLAKLAYSGNCTYKATTSLAVVIAAILPHVDPIDRFHCTIHLQLVLGIETHMYYTLLNFSTATSAPCILFGFRAQPRDRRMWWVLTNYEYCVLNFGSLDWLSSCQL